MIRRGAPILRLALVGLAAGALAGCLRPRVIRVIDGEARTGDFVTPGAYADYARGAIAEREGRLDEASAAYAAAAAASHEPAAYARLGATLCAGGRLDAARKAFADGLGADPDAALVLRERARCALTRGALAEAVGSAQRAVDLDPTDRESIAVLRDALARSGRAGDAAVLAAEAQARQPAVRSGVDPASSVAISRPPRPTHADVDAALARGDGEGAMRIATAARIDRAELSARALAHGLRALAGELAHRVLAADPMNGTAWCIAAATDLGPGDEQALREQLGHLPEQAPSPLAALLYGEILLRRAGPDAALAFVPPSALDRPRTDPLEERVRLRLRDSLPRP